jgi:hypothetical protein
MLTKSPLRGRGGTAAEVNRKYLERLTDAVAVGEMHHSDAPSSKAKILLIFQKKLLLFQNYLYKSEKMCYNMLATQLNMPSDGKHTLVKGVSLFPFPEKWQGCVAAMRDSLFRCVSFEAHFLIVHKYFF